MRFFLGVDGGQSGTTAVIGDESGQMLGTGRAGPCNHAVGSEGRLKLENAVRESVSAALAQAGLGSSSDVRFEAACFGMSGGPEDKRATIETLLSIDTLIVTTDAVVALAGATKSGQGIVTIAGTGSIALGRNAVGSLARVGGWGYVFGDEGSGFDIVRQAVRAGLRMEEGWGPATSLADILRQATAAATMNELLHMMYTPEWPRDKIATLAPLVDSAAAAGDAVATGILNAAGAQLATLAASVRAQLWKAQEEIEVAYIGGVFRSGIVRERFRMLVQLEPGVRCIPPLRSPAEGALREAYKAVGMVVH